MLKYINGRWQRLPDKMPEPNIDYMSFDLDELIGAVYNWCHNSAEGLRFDAGNLIHRVDPGEKDYLLSAAKDCDTVKAKMAEALEVMFPGLLQEFWEAQEEIKINRCMAL